MDGRGLDFGAEMDERSILLSTVVLFASAIAIAILLLAGALWAVMRRGRRELTAGDSAP